MMRKTIFGRFGKIGTLALAGVSFAAFGDTLYVDDDNYNEAYATYQDYVNAGFDGSTKEKAFGTIQMAIDAAKADGVVKVCPGVYTNGTSETVSWSHNSYNNVKQKARVHITKKLTLESTDGQLKTIIRGACGTYSSDPTGKNSAYYVDGVTCIVVADAAAGSTIRGFTIENGWPHQSAFKSSYGAGGIIKANFQDETDFLVTDSTFDTCYGRGAGAIVCGTAIRCAFTRCGTTEVAGVAYKSCLYNCLFNRNGMAAHSARGDLYEAIAVNCTIVNETKYTTGVRGATRLYNSVNYSHYKKDAVAETVASNCVSEAELSSDSYKLTKITQSDVSTMTNVCLCPAVDDFRPVKGGVLDGKGDRAYLAEFTWLPADEINIDFNGNPIEATDALPIGILLPAAQVKSGVLVSQNDSYPYNFNGVDQASVAADYYYQTDEWPASVRLKPSTALSDGKPFVYITILDTNIYPGRYDHIVQMMPKAGVVYTLGAYEQAKYEYYVGGDNPSDSNAGTKDAPFATIQRAIDQNVADTIAEHGDWGRPTVVHVRPGTYGAATGTYANEPGNLDTNSVNYGIRSSINVPTKLNVHVLADEGPEKTFIEGAPDPDTKGVGPKAIRCLGVHTTCNCAFSGFTFQDGYSESYTNYNNKNLSPLVGVGSESQQFYDCIFTKAHGRVPCRGGWYHRCLFTANTNCDAGVAYQIALSSCIFANNNASMSYALYNDVKAFNCSVYESVYKGTLQNRNGTIINCAYDALNSTMINFQDKGVTIDGSVIKASSQAAQTLYGDGFQKADPFFADPTKFDFRLNTSAENPSPAIGRGVLTDRYGKYTDKQMLIYVRSDFSNRSLVDATGGIYAGAVAETRAASEAVYAGPDGDDDNNDGRSPDRPLTLQGATACYRPANDGKKVIVKAGTYDTGSQLYTGRTHNEGLKQATLRSRVVVPAGFTLESAEGPEKTIIVGAADTTVNKYGLGLGPDAIRCAFVDNNAVLKGFTLTGGHTDYYDSKESRYDSSYQDNLWGAGVMGRSYTTNPSIVENCIISNNFADLGGAGGYAAFYGCRVVHNVGYRYGGFFRMGGAYNCYVADCRGPRVCDVINACVNCTFGEKCWNYSSESATHCFANVAGNTKIWNLLLCGDTVSDFDLGASSDIRNLVAPKGFKPSATSLSGCTWSGEILTNEYTVAEMSELYTNGVPRVRTAPSVDKGYASAYDLLRATATDASGVSKRMANGTLDIGAYEYDWYADYSKALGRRVTVTNATAMVYEGSDNLVTLHPADTMALLWTGSERGCDYTIGVTFGGDGSGEFTVKLNGAEIRKLTQTGTVSFSNALTENALEFAYTGDGTATITGLNRFQGTVLMIR